MDRIKDKVTIITGAGSGIGRATALRFGAEGAIVVVTDIRASTAAATAEEINKEGGRAISMAVDCGVESQLKDMIDNTIAQFGRIDVLYNNAIKTADMQKKSDDNFLEFDRSTFYDIVDVNVLGGVLASKCVIPYMIKQGGGVILFTSSCSSLGGDVAQFSYGASKAMVNWYVQTIATTFGKQGIRCNAILPGVIQTPSQKAWSTPEMDKEFLDLQNVPRLGLPEDIAALALFLASDESSYINGTHYRCDGGMTAGVPFVPLMRKLLLPQKAKETNE
ncbi:MAG: glucose 1-dehydrogenase [Verrucomicrobiaceae bacterium]|nr:glucose 1-dehydrogenase [Verrucomicrobiaceae bacterium]